MARGSSRARRFELVAGTSSKFWQIAQNGRDQTVTFGRIGTAGTSKTKTFATAEEATGATEKLIAEKERKGYREARAAGVEPRTPAKKPGSASNVPRSGGIATDPVSAFFLERAGIGLPGHVLTFWKFWTALARPQQGTIRDALGVEPVFSLFEFFHPTRAGELSRLRGDPQSFAWNEDCPPEFFSFLSGGDGPVIYGIWIDDPAVAEGFVVRYVRGGDLVPVGGTLFDALDDAYARAVKRASYSYDGDESLEPARKVIASAAGVRQGLPRGPALEKDRLTIKKRIPILSGVGVVSPDAKTIAPARQARLPKLGDELRQKAAIARAVAAALRSCRAGSPGDALALGHDLIWCGAHREALPLLTEAYRALGREPLAEVAAARAKMKR